MRATPSIQYLRNWYGRELPVDFGPLALKEIAVSVP